MKKMSLLLPTILISLFGPTVTRIHADVIGPNDPIVQKVPQSIEQLYIHKTEGFIGYIAPETPRIATFDNKTNTIVYEDAVARPTNSPIKNKFTNVNLSAWDPIRNDWVVLTTQCEVTDIDMGPYLSYVRLKFNFTMTPGEANTYFNYRVSADWLNDATTPAKPVTSWTEFGRIA